MSYYPSRCLGPAAISGVFENQVYETQVETPPESTKTEKDQENDSPASKKAKLTPEEKENKRIGS